jgi:hypothetical protein
MKDGRRALFRRIKGKAITTPHKIVQKEIHGQVVYVKVYPPQWAEGASRQHSGRKKNLGKISSAAQQTLPTEIAKKDPPKGNRRRQQGT